MHIKQSIEAKVAMALVGLTVLSGLILSNIDRDGAAVADASAATNGTASASVTVADACSMAVSGNNGVASEDGYTYSATVNNGSTQVVTANSIMASCNDYAGFIIYAIGYSGDALGGTDMIASTGEDYNIKTDASGTYGSYWKMKLTKANSIDTTIPSAYASYNVIPDDYALVAQYASNTGNTASTASMITPSYQIYVGSAQPAGTYTGKVKYTLVHPTSAVAPEISRPTMQDFSSSDFANMSVGSTTTLKDSRTGNTYEVAMLSLNGIKTLWMMSNLKLPGGTALTTSDSNVSAPYTLPSDVGSSGWVDEYCKPYMATAGGEYYYNWPAATARTNSVSSTDPMAGCYNDDNNSVGDICPKGWRLPAHSGEVDNETWRADLLATGNLTRTGMFRSKLPYESCPKNCGNGSQFYVGDYGSWWQSTAINLFVFGNHVYYSDDGNVDKASGLSVRCMRTN